MLAPSNRLTLIDAMRPPAGFQLESAMAVTFTLNLQTLLAVPAAFTISGLDESENDGGPARPVELIHALRVNAGKLTVFSEAGYISLPPASRALGFLERAVVPVKAPGDGIVHPKVWALCYQEAASAEDGQAQSTRLRVLISSRNLTFDPSWDTMLRLDQTLGPGGARLDAVGDLFTGLLNTTITEAAAVHQTRVASLVEALGTAHFRLPDGVDDLRVHLFGFDGNKPSPFPESPDRGMIIAPFLTDGFFDGVYTGPVDTLVSRRKSLDELSTRILNGIPDIRIFDDGDSFEALDELDTGDSTSGGRSRALSADDPGRPLRGLHAKVFAFEKGSRANLFVGSANATGAAFSHNVEILAELRGPIDQLGIDHLMKGDEDQPGLETLLYVYHKGDVPDTPDDESKAIDRMRREIARLEITGTVEQGDTEGQEWAVTYRSEGPLPGGEGIEISCWPVTSPGHRRRIEAQEPLEARFATSLERISGFLAFELTDGSGEQTGFVIPVTLEGLPEHRDRHLLKALIGDPRRFLRYLLALLYDESPEHGLPGVVGMLERSAGSADGGAIRLAVLEQLLRTMRRDPAKLAGLHPLISDLRDDDALPEGFAELWDAIYEVAIGDDPSQGGNAP